MAERTLTLNKEPAFWIGDRIYIVGQAHFSATAPQYVTYEATCPCCNDTKIVKVTGNDGNEYNVVCPVCGRKHHGSHGSEIEIKNFEVHEYIVNEIRAAGPASVSKYKSGDARMDYIEMYAFNRYGRGSNDFVRERIPCLSDDYRINPTLTDICIDESNYRNQERYIFTDRREAAKYCGMLKDFDKNRLETFNETYHTNHKYPF